MSRVVNFFQDNAMFYKDITQWLRNRTFASLFFGLLLVAEVMSLFIINGSDDIASPGVSMFYALYMVLIIYAMLIAYLGNSLTSREFVNRTFELFELSGMSLERMVGGKLLSMLYQFFFGFFCLVPFMFFAYFLGGLDFFEMLVGVILIGVMALPLYLLALATALAGRFKQINLLAKMGTLFLLICFAFFAVVSFFSRRSPMQETVSDLTKQVKEMLNGSMQASMGFAFFFVVYAQVCLLLFYFCCDSISRETDSREIPIKALVASLIVSWMGFFGVMINNYGYSRGNVYFMCVPVFVTLLILGVRTYYARTMPAPIVAGRYRDSRGFRRLFYELFKPGIQGSVRSMFFLIGLAVLGGTIAVSDIPLFTGRIAGSGGLDEEWWAGMSLLIQTPWFLAVPHIFYARAKEMRFNYAGQRTIAVAVWVVLGSLVLVYLAWVRSNLFNSGNETSTAEVLIVTLLSPLPSLSVVGSNNEMMTYAGSFIRISSGLLGMILMWNHSRKVLADEKTMVEEAQVSVADDDGNSDTAIATDS